MTRAPPNPARPPPRRPAKVWAWSGVAADEGDEAAAWLSAVIGKRARLVRYLGSLDPAAPAATAALAARAVVEGEGAAGAEGAAATLFRAVSPEFVPWGAEVAFAGVRRVAPRCACAQPLRRVAGRAARRAAPLPPPRPFAPRGGPRPRQLHPLGPQTASLCWLRPPRRWMT